VAAVSRVVDAGLDCAYYYATFIKGTIFLIMLRPNFNRTANGELF